MRSACLLFFLKWRLANSRSSFESIDWIVSQYFKCLWSTRPSRDDRIYNISLRHNSLRLSIWRHVLRHWSRLWYNCHSSFNNGASRMSERGRRDERLFCATNRQDYGRRTAFKSFANDGSSTTTEPLLAHVSSGQLSSGFQWPSSTLHHESRRQPCTDERSPGIGSVSRDRRPTYATSVQIKFGHQGQQRQRSKSNSIWLTVTLPKSVFFRLRVSGVQ